MRIRLVPALAGLLSLPLAAEDAPPAPPVSDGGTVVVSATRLAADPIEQPYAFYRHDREDLDQAVGRTALDRMNYGPGVFIQATSPAQASPYIRGLTGEQTLLLLDGVRLSHATMRPGPNQYAALIPDMSIASIDAVLGASAAATGSDGLTGALDIRLAEPGRGVDAPLSPWGRARVDHANGTQLAAGVDGVTEDWAWSVEGGYDRYHDRIGGHEASENLLGGAEADDSIPNTAYDQSHAAGRVAYTGLADHRFTMKVGHTNQMDAPRPDGYPENSKNPSNISRYFDPHRYTYAHLGHVWSPEGDGWLEALRTTVWYHWNDEHETRERVTGPGYRREEKRDQIAGIGLDSALDHRLGDHLLTYGLAISAEETANEYARYDGTSEATAVRVGTDLQDSQRTTVPDGSTYNTLAVFIQDQWQINERWELLAGLRLSSYSWESEVEGRSGFAGEDTVEGDTSDVSGGLRAGWHFRDDMLAFAGVGKTFRAPNLTNLTGISDRASSNVPTFGNPDLDPEVAWTAELGWKWQQGRDLLQATVFATTIDDLIQAVYTDVNGDGQITSADEGNMVNAESAELGGFELSWDWGIPWTGWLPHCERLAVVGATSLVDAEVDQPQPDGSVEEEHLSRANRLYGLFGIRGEFRGGWWVQPQLRWHDAYDEVSPSDAGDVRLTSAGNPDGSMPGYGVFDIAAGWASDDGHRQVALTMENLGNKTYREPGSAVDGAGFNVGLSGGVRF